MLSRSMTLASAVVVCGAASLLAAFSPPAATLSRLRAAGSTVWWLRLGISIERIKPGHPQQNGRHERMHLTLKKETTRPPGANSLQQQARFDAFVQEFNAERPHEALQMKRPADVYLPSLRPYKGLPELHYPLHERQVLVTSCGRICMHRKRINISTVFAGQRVGIKEVDEGV
jgi:transposase InsO family protein